MLAQLAIPFKLALLRFLAMCVILLALVCAADSSRGSAQQRSVMRAQLTLERQLVASAVAGVFGRYIQSARRSAAQKDFELGGDEQSEIMEEYVYTSSVTQYDQQLRCLVQSPRSKSKPAGGRPLIFYLHGLFQCGDGKTVDDLKSVNASLLNPS